MAELLIITTADLDSDHWERLTQATQEIVASVSLQPRAVDHHLVDELRKRGIVIGGPGTQVMREAYRIAVRLRERIACPC